jgi:hypothetical protein
VPVEAPPLTLKQAAAKLGWSYETTRRFFASVDGCIRLTRPEKLHKRKYESVRVPVHIFEREYRKLTSAPDPVSRDTTVSSAKWNCSTASAPSPWTLSERKICAEQIMLCNSSENSAHKTQGIVCQGGVSFDGPPPNTVKG